MERTYGLIGFPLSHSFSKRYFSEKFEKEGIKNCVYQLFPLEHISELTQLLTTQPNLMGLNVTIPYKEQVLPFLDELAESAQRVGAVNTIKINNGRLVGHNTDVYGFQVSLERFLVEKNEGLSALILGTGGAAKAVAFSLQVLNIPFKYVSRQAQNGNFSYEDIDNEVLQKHKLIINTTPLGMSPKIDTFPPLPYHLLTNKHLLFDLVYNPEQTLFLQKGQEKGCATQNGLEMLILQAERAWQIWNDF